MDEISERRLKGGASDSIDAVIAEKRRAQENERHVQGMKDGLAKLDQNCTVVATQAAEFAKEYGFDDYRTEMMIEFLDMLIEINENMKLFSATSSVMSMIGDVINLVDEIMDFNSGVLQNSVKKKYGFFARLREKRRVRRAMQNNRNRMIAMYDMILMQQQMAQDMTDSLSEAAAEMRMRREKIKKKRAALAEKRRKKGHNPVVAGSRNAAEKMVQNILNKSVADGGDTSATPGTPGTPGAPVSGDGSSKDMPDINDIL